MCGILVRFDLSNASLPRLLGQIYGIGVYVYARAIVSPAAQQKKTVIRLEDFVSFSNISLLYILSHSMYNHLYYFDDCD